MLSLVSLHSAIKKESFSAKRKGGNFVFGDYPRASFVSILRMNANPWIITV